MNRPSCFPGCPARNSSTSECYPQLSPGGRPPVPPDERLRHPRTGYRPTVDINYPTSVFTAAVISARAFFASAKYMLVLELAYSSLSMPA
jgi:hypothetical protein